MSIKIELSDYNDMGNHKLFNSIQDAMCDGYRIIIGNDEFFIADIQMIADINDSIETKITLMQIHRG